MSLAVVRWVVENDPSPRASTARAVLFAIAWHADDAGGNAFPSQPTMVRISGAKERAVRDALRALEDAGTIKRTGARPGGGTVVWRVVMDPEESRAIAATRALGRSIRNGDGPA